MTDWPRPPPLDSCRAAALAAAPPDDAALAVAVKKICGGLAASERALLSVSEYADALAARIALECARAEGARLFASNPAVDAAAVDELARLAAGAAERLGALGGKTREVEKLRLFASAEASLHRELQAFQDLAGHLRKAGPRSVALDPATVRTPGPEEPDLEEESSPQAGLMRVLEQAKSRWRLALLGALLLLLVLSFVRALLFTAAEVETLEAASAGAEIAEVRLSGDSAAVIVRPGWQPAQLPQLLEALRPRGVTSALLILDSGTGLGQLDVASGKLYLAERPDAGP